MRYYDPFNPIPPMYQPLPIQQSPTGPAPQRQQQGPGVGVGDIVEMAEALGLGGGAGVAGTGAAGVGAGGSASVAAGTPNMMMPALEPMLPDMAMYGGAEAGGGAGASAAAGVPLAVPLMALAIATGDKWAPGVAQMGQKFSTGVGFGDKNPKAPRLQDDESFMKRAVEDLGFLAPEGIDPAKFLSEAENRKLLMYSGHGVPGQGGEMRASDDAAVMFRAPAQAWKDAGFRMDMGTIPIRAMRGLRAKGDTKKADILEQRLRQVYSGFTGNRPKSKDIDGFNEFLSQFPGEIERERQSIGRQQLTQALKEGMVPVQRPTKETMQSYEQVAQQAPQDVQPYLKNWFNGRVRR